MNNSVGSGGGRIIAETVAVVATDAAVEDEHLMTMEALRERNRARCIGLAMMLLGRTCVLLAICEVGIGGAIYSFYTNAHYGSWWSCVACALSGIWSTTKVCGVTTVVVFLSLCLILSFPMLISAFPSSLSLPSLTNTNKYKQ